MTDPPVSRAVRLPAFGWWIGASLAAAAALVWILLLRPIVVVNRFLREANAAGCTASVSYDHPGWFRHLASRCGADSQDLFIPGWSAIVGFRNDFEPMRDSWVHALAAARNIDEIDLQGPTIDDEQVGRLAGVRGLQRLKLGGDGVTDAGLLRLALRTELTSLSVSGTAVSDEGLASIGRMTNLSSVDIERSQVIGHGLRHLRALPKLESLSLGGPGLSDEAFDEIGYFLALRALSLHNSHLTAVRARGLRRCTTLERIVLRDSKFGPDAFRELSDSATLAAIEARWPGEGSTDLSSADLSPLLDLKTLQLLFLHDANLTDDQIRPLASHSRLSNLGLRGNDILGTAFREPGWSSLASLDLADTPCDDRAVAALARLPELERLVLDGTRITDACVIDLARFPKLAELSVSTGALSSQALKDLAGKRPGLTVRIDFHSATIAAPPK